MAYPEYSECKHRMKQGSFCIFWQYAAESGVSQLKDSKLPKDKRGWSTLSDSQLLHNNVNHSVCSSPFCPLDERLEYVLTPLGQQSQKKLIMHTKWLQSYQSTTVDGVMCSMNIAQLCRICYFLFTIPMTRSTRTLASFLVCITSTAESWLFPFLKVGIFIEAKWNPTLSPRLKLQSAF